MTSAEDRKNRTERARLWVDIAAIIVGAIVTIQVTQINAKATAAAKEVKEVKQTLSEATTATDTKLEELAVTADATHTLVNSNMGVQLRLNAELSRWKALQTGKPADAEAADLAEKLLREHELKQADVDRQGEL